MPSPWTPRPGASTGFSPPPDPDSPWGAQAITVDLLSPQGSFGAADLSAWTIHSQCAAEAGRCRLSSINGIFTLPAILGEDALSYGSAGAPARVSFALRHEQVVPTQVAFILQVDAGDGVLNDMLSITPAPGAGAITYVYDFTTVGPTGRVRFRLQPPTLPGGVDAFLDNASLVIGSMTPYTPPAPAGTSWGGSP